MEQATGRAFTGLLLANCVSLALAGLAQAQSNPVAASDDAGRLQRLEARVEAQDRQIEELRRLLSEQQRQVVSLQAGQLDEFRARGAAEEAASPASQEQTPIAPWPSAVGETAVARGAMPAQAAIHQSDGQDLQVGRAPEELSRPPEVAQIFDQPGILTPSGKFILEPSLQVGYYASDRVALVGYTIIPAILIGLIDVRQVKTTGINAALTGRYGLTNRLELELKVPYLYVSSDTVSREIFTGTAQDNVFNADGNGLGDVEFTGRYQLTNRGPERPFYVVWLRYKSRTGKDLFEVPTDCVTRCVANATGTGLPLELPTGSGFTSLQSGVTWLYASDPVVFFGSFSYLYNVPRDNVSRTVLTGAPEGFPQTTTEPIGDVEAGDIFGFNIGVGLALNEKAAISFGFEQDLVGKTKQNGEDAPGAVRVMLGTLVLGGSYRFSERTSLNMALSVGVTDDTPDVSLNVRVPITF